MLFTHPSFLQLDGELYLAPGFPAPPNTDYKGYHQYIDDALPPETPYLYGLHPNAEIEFLTQTSESLFRVLLELQPRDTGAADGGGDSREDVVGTAVDYMLCFNVTCGVRLLSRRMPDSQSREPVLKSPLLPFRSLGIFVLSIDTLVDSAV